MSKADEVFITDACLLRDLDAGGITFIALQLESKWIIPGPIARELQHQIPDSINTLFLHGLERYELSDKLIIAIDQSLEKYKGLTYQDVAALELARELNGLLLTSDKLLRLIAESEGIPCHGTLWLLDQLVEKYHYLAPQQGVRAIKNMLEKGRRLPEKECEKRIRKWRKKKSGR